MGCMTRTAHCAHGAHGVHAADGALGNMGRMGCMGLTCVMNLPSTRPPVGEALTWVFTVHTFLHYNLDPCTPPITGHALL